MRTWIFTLLVALCATPAFAQVAKLGPNDSLRITWPAYVAADPDGLDAPDGYRVKAVKNTDTGVVVQSWQTGLVTSLDLNAQQLPAGAFRISVHPFNAAGEAAASNLSGPFGLAATPKIQTGVSVVVVAGGQ